MDVIAMTRKRLKKSQANESVNFRGFVERKLRHVGKGKESMLGSNVNSEGERGRVTRAPAWPSSPFRDRRHPTSGANHLVLVCNILLHYGWVSHLKLAKD